MATATDLRVGVEGLVAYAAADLDALWGQVQTPEEIRQALSDTVPALVEVYGVAAAALAADWYDNLRDEAAVRGRFTAIPADIPDAGAQALVGWAVSTAQDDAALRTLVSGGVQRRVANFSRFTVMGSAIADPAAAGWQRVGAGGCTSGFCDMLIARGAVYSEATADFAAHDHCKCAAVPAWGGEAKPVKAYTPSLRHRTPKQRAQLRDYLRENYPRP